VIAMVERILLWLSVRRWLRFRMIELGLRPKWTQSNEVRRRLIRIVIMLPHDYCTRRGLAELVGALLGVEKSRVGVYRFGPCELHVIVPRRTSRRRIAFVASALEAKAPVGMVYRIEREK
jgi:hypothetical protein